ncbi:MAG: GNAT family N-acetyltransferase [Actinomycetes bacterium]
MRELSPGWATDLSILEFSGSTLDEREGHLVVRTPSNPDYHWGNCLFVTDAVDDADRWMGTFHETFPHAGWIAIGLIAMPEDRGAWTDQGVELELDEVLTTRTLPRQTPLHEDYTVRRIEGDDWEQVVVREMLANKRRDEYEPESHERFVRARTDSRRSISDRGLAAFFGAFADDVLVADLGIVRCGTRARYQTVGTDEDHRRRGLASHLLGVAARWAAERGCDEWVILTETTNPAGRIYRSVGFQPDSGNAQAYRRPPR